MGLALACVIVMALSEEVSLLIASIAALLLTIFILILAWKFLWIAFLRNFAFFRELVTPNDDERKEREKKARPHRKSEKTH